MSILVIGGAGYIGTAIYNIMEVSVADNLLYEDRFLEDVPFYYCDVRDIDKLNKIVHNFDTVIVLAGIVGDAACAVNPQFTYDTNVKHVKWLADNYSGKVVFTSTCSVYGKNDKILDESSEVNPLSVYAETKLMAEQYLLTKKPDSLIFRLGTLYGMSGSYSRPRLDLVVNVLTMKAAIGEKLRVFGGDQWRPILHVKDVASAIKFGLNSNLSGLYNLGEQNITIKGMAENIVKLIPGSSVSYEDILFEDRRNYKVDFNKILSTGWAPVNSFARGVLDMHKVFHEKRIKNLTNPLYHNGNYIEKNIGQLHG
jgi:nucleoside-diphosphate-sugar epimerase